MARKQVHPKLLFEVWQKDWLFLSGLYSIILIIFSQAFKINFFIDDFFFLKISRVKSFMEVVDFFSPFKDYFYRPIPTELFYYLIHLTGETLWLAHTMVFAVYFLGLYAAYQVLLIVTRNQLWSRLTIFLYGISFIHVFQLYQLATFIEIGLFSFLAWSTYYFCKEKYSLSLGFFILAAMCKETAVLFPIFLSLFTFMDKSHINSFKKIIPYLAVSGLFGFIYSLGVNEVVTTVDTYRIRLEPKLGLNSLWWYGLWAVGFPSFMPDYFVSIWQPIPEFWQLLENRQIQVFFGFLISYIVLIILSLIWLWKNVPQQRQFFIKLLLFCGINFVVFISPTIFITHKWMVRLMLPLFFVSLSYGYIISQLLARNKMGRWMGLLTLLTLVAFNLIAIPIHEESSTYLFETKIVNFADQYFATHRAEILAHDVLYFQDPALKEQTHPWGYSQKLKVTFHDQSFLVHYFPDSELSAVYSFDQPTAPDNSFIVPVKNFIPL